MKTEQAVVLVKPDGVQRGLVGEIISRFERKGLKLVAIKMTKMTDQMLEDWYSHHTDKPFFPKLKASMQAAPVVAMLLEGLDCTEAVRILTGITLGRKADAGSIRGDLSMSQQLNIIHASDSPEGARKERDLIFTKDDIFDYQKDLELHVYSEEERGE